MQRTWKSFLCSCSCLIALASPILGQQGNTVTIHGTGAPVGACGPILQYINDNNGAFYICWLGAWNLVAGGGGGVTTINPGGNVGPIVTFQTGTAGLDFGLSNPGANIIQIDLPAADAAHTGKLRFGDWTTFNGKAGTGVCAAGQYENQDGAGGPTCAQVGYGQLGGVPATFPATAHNILSATHGDSTPSSAVLGGMIYADVTPKWVQLAGNATATKMYLSQTGTGLVSAPPSWLQPACSDLSDAGTGCSGAAYPGLVAHDLLSATHGDTTAAAVVRGDVITGQGGPAKWTRLAKGAASECLQMDGTATDVTWGPCAVGGFPRLDQVLDPTADKTFTMGANFLDFSWAAYAVKHESTGSTFGNGSDFVLTFNDTAPSSPVINFVGEYWGINNSIIQVDDTITDGSTFEGVPLIFTDSRASVPNVADNVSANGIETDFPISGAGSVGITAYSIGFSPNPADTTSISALGYVFPEINSVAFGSTVLNRVTEFSAGNVEPAVSGPTYAYFSLMNSGSNKWAFYGGGTAPSHFGGTTDATRFKSSGTALGVGDFALGAGWGNTAAVVSIAGTDQAHRYTITSNGVGIAANPTIALTFHDGTWTTVPVFVCKQTGGTGIITDITQAETATTLTLTWHAVPTAGATYTFSCIGMGI